MLAIHDRETHKIVVKERVTSPIPRDQRRDLILATWEQLSLDFPDRFEVTGIPISPEQ